MANSKSNYNAAILNVRWMRRSTNTIMLTVDDEVHNKQSLKFCLPSEPFRIFQHNSLYIMFDRFFAKIHQYIGHKVNKLNVNRNGCV